MSNMIRRSLDPNDEHHSPLDNGRIDEGFANIDVALLYWPDEEAFKRMVYKATLATRGSELGSDDYDETVVEDAFAGGLNQCLEWVTVVFEISGVTRGLTHELVRTRKASFAQQSGRHTFMGYAPAMRMPKEISRSQPPERIAWHNAIAQATQSYNDLVSADVPYQDARTVLPVGIETYIIASYPLSVFLQTYAYRACHMFYPEIVYLFRKMKIALLVECPWLEPFIKISCEKTKPNGDEEHMCTYQGWEQVEGHCPLDWAKEDNRVWKSRKFEN